jgi:hypothetical protein
MIELKSTITCPSCGHRETHTMPTDACVYLFTCAACGKTAKPKSGHCCVYCSYGDVPCPPIQDEGVCCAPSEKGSGDMGSDPWV